MSPSKVKTPKVIKFVYKNKERLWLRVDIFENNLSTLNGSHTQQYFHPFSDSHSKLVRLRKNMSDELKQSSFFAMFTAL